MDGLSKEGNGRMDGGGDERKERREGRIKRWMEKEGR